MSHFARTTILLALLVLVGELLLAPLLTFGGIGPDFALIALFILALAGGSFAACTAGFLVGLVQDLGQPSLLGLGALCKTLFGFAVGRFRGRLVYGMPLYEGGLLAIAVFAHDALYLLLAGFLGQGAFFRPLFLTALPSAVFTGLVGIPLIRLADLLGILRGED